MTAEHFSMTEKHPYEIAPPDHPLFLRLADLASRYDHPSAGSIRSTVSLLNQLPPKLRNQIGYENAYRLYKLKK